MENSSYVISCAVLLIARSIPYLMQAMQPVQIPVYDFTLHQRAQETRRVEPADVVIIEGILVLHVEAVRKVLNMKVFVDTDDDVRLARR